MINQIIEGDCLEVLKTLPSEIFDLLYTNPPFGITNAKWDSPLKWDKLWPEIWRVMKPRGAVVLHSSMPFTFDLVATERTYFRYNYIWVKNIATGFFNVKNAPLRKHEDICVFYRKQPTYNPQMAGDELNPKRIVKHGGSEEYWGKAKFEGKWGKLDYENGHRGRYPSTILFYPTKKSSPNEEDAGTRNDDMISFFIKTYSNKGDNVLNITSYKGDTEIISKKLGRNFIGIEKQPMYAQIAKERIERMSNTLFVP